MIPFKKKVNDLHMFFMPIKRINNIVLYAFSEI